MKIFISHIHEEAKLGGVLKSWIEDAFPGQVTVFLSSDPKDLPGGRKWSDDIHARLRDGELRILLSLISSESLLRPWISIELGAAWIQDRAVIPFCHSGIKKGELPRPLGDFVAIELERDDSARLLLDAIADALKLRYSRGLHLEKMQKEMVAACADLTYSTAPPARTTQRGLEEEEVRILQTLCMAKDRDGDGDVETSVLAGLVQVPVSKLEWRMDRLVDDRLARDSYHSGGRYFSIREKGTEALIRLDKYPS